MLKYYSLKKYGRKFSPTLEKRYGRKQHYSASEVRATVYQNDFNPKYLPLAYLLYLEKNMLKNVLYAEYPELNVAQYKEDIINYLSKKNYSGSLLQLHSKQV